MTDSARSPVAGKSETGDPLLLTPGPLTTSRSVKEVMVHDWGSRDATFLRINKEVLDRLPEIVSGTESFVTVPMQGSGTFAVEAMLTTFIPADGKCLVLINGAYGHRAKKILDIAKRANVVYETPEDTPPDLAEIDRILSNDRAITHVFGVHCETTSGVLNPISEVAQLTARHGRRFLLDSMSAFGALALDVAETPCRRHRRLVQQMHRGGAGPGLRAGAARRPWRRLKATRQPWSWTCTTSGAASSRPGNIALPRRST